jgi:hypothetical protein
MVSLGNDWIAFRTHSVAMVASIQRTDLLETRLFSRRPMAGT